MQNARSFDQTARDEYIYPNTTETRSDKMNGSSGAEQIIWRLEDLYSGGDDPALDNDLSESLQRAETFASVYRGRIADLAAAEMKQLLEESTNKFSNSRERRGPSPTCTGPPTPTIRPGERCCSGCRNTPLNSSNDCCSSNWNGPMYPNSEPKS